MSELHPVPALESSALSLRERIALLEDEKLRQFDVLHLRAKDLTEVVYASHGLTGTEVAAQTNTTEGAINNRRCRLAGSIGIHHIPNLALVVRLCIEAGNLPIETVEASPALIEEEERNALVLGTLGLTVKETALFAHKAVDTIRHQRHEGFNKLSARNITHATRRLYEVGILQRGEYGAPS